MILSLYLPQKKGPLFDRSCFHTPVLSRVVQNPIPPPIKLHPLDMSSPCLRLLHPLGCGVSTTPHRKLPSEPESASPSSLAAAPELRPSRDNFEPSSHVPPNTPSPLQRCYVTTLFRSPLLLGLVTPVVSVFVLLSPAQADLLLNFSTVTDTLDSSSTSDYPVRSRGRSG